MTRSQAESLISRVEGRLCARYYRRNCGSVLTKECPVGLRETKRRIKRTTVAFISAVIGLCTGLGVNAAAQEISHAFERSRHAIGGLAYRSVTEPEPSNYVQEQTPFLQGVVIRLEPKYKKRKSKSHPWPTKPPKSPKTQR